MNAVGSALRGTARALADTYRLGGRALVRAPALVAFAVVPEFVQHIVEIRLGMFHSIAQARAFADSATRWNFGYVKLAGFALAILLVARFWATGASVRRALLIPPATLLRLLAAIAVFVMVGTGIGRLDPYVSLPAVHVLLSILSWVLQLGLIVWMVAILVEDRETTLAAAFTRRLPTAALLLVLLAAAFAPAQALHGLDHHLALGRPEPLVWLLMIWDALVVGLLAALVGSALHVAHASGASWRGWGRSPAEREPLDA